MDLHGPNGNTTKLRRRIAGGSATAKDSTTAEAGFTSDCAIQAFLNHPGRSMPIGPTPLPRIHINRFPDSVFHLPVLPFGDGIVAIQAILCEGHDVQYKFVLSHNLVLLILCLVRLRQHYHNIISSITPTS